MDLGTRHAPGPKEIEVAQRGAPNIRKSLADVLADLATSVHPRAMEKAVAWFQEVLR